MADNLPTGDRRCRRCRWVCVGRDSEPEGVTSTHRLARHGCRHRDIDDRVGYSDAESGRGVPRRRLSSARHAVRLCKRAA